MPRMWLRTVRLSTVGRAIIGKRRPGIGSSEKYFAGRE